MSEAFAAAAEEEMRTAGEEEKRLAIERGDVIDGIQHIPVITDGSWMKRSYRTGSYDSPSGAAIITGYHSKKVLFVGVRNKYCIVCARVAKINVVAKEHTCFKNWGSNQSSTSMESDIILEGFRLSLEMHGLIYSKYIGDGDSNVLKKLRDFPPYPNIVVEKIECTNHFLRNLCNKIREAGSTGSRNVSKLKKAVASSVMKIRNAVVKAVDFRRNRKVSWQIKISELIKDLNNIPSHVFGEHKDCASLQYFCNGQQKEGEENLASQLQRAGFLQKVENAMKRVIENADSLLYKFTSNSVESCNAIISKFIGGKRVHYAMKGSYQTRVKASVVQCNTPRTLSSVCRAMNKKPPTQTEIIEKRNINKNANQLKRTRAAKDLGLSVRTSKFFAKISADKNYGSNVERPDIVGNMYEQLRRNHYEMLLDQQRNCAVLECATRDQHENPEWHNVRRNLLTASNFGKVCSRREITSCQNLVKAILYPPRLTSAAVEWGKEKEMMAREQLQMELGIEINKCGIFIDGTIPYLAATPDGIVGDDTIVEIKCPYAARHVSPINAMLKKISDIHRIFDKTDDTRMNQRHAYYFQVQGQLHITQRKYCIFAVWTPFGFKYTIVVRDDRFWETKMLSQLKRFYEDCLVPEIIDSRAARNMPIREPQYVIEAQEAARKNDKKVESSIEASKQLLSNSTTTVPEQDDDCIIIDYCNEKRDLTEDDIRRQRKMLDNVIPSFLSVKNNVLPINSKLNDESLDLFLRIVRETSCFETQSVLYLEYPHIIEASRSNKSLQIIGGNCTDHWRCILFDGTKLHVYDSLPGTTYEKLAAKEKEYIRLRYPKITKYDIIFEEVQTQPDCTSCGIYAAAFATTIALKGNPCNEKYSSDVKCMRRHLITILESNKLLPFPN